MQLERFYLLLSRKMSGEATVQELDELNELIKANYELRQFVKILSREHKEQEMSYHEMDAFFAVHSTKLQLKFEEQKTSETRKEISSYYKMLSKKNIRIIFAIAAVFVLVLGILFLRYNMPFIKENRISTNEIVSKKGSISTVKLPDGTTVVLNADSKLSYMHEFSGKIREVYLSGEGYFDVAKDSTRPFIVHTDKINIRVLGTAFNVKSYPQDDVIETSLIHGKIEVTYNDRPMEKTILKPNEKLLIRKNQEEVKNSNESLPKVQVSNIVPAQGNIISETAWLENKIVFSNESLKNICRMLERRFAVQFEFKDDEVQYFAYTGVFERESLEKIMQYMSISESFNYTIIGNKVIISK